MVCFFIKTKFSKVIFTLFRTVPDQSAEKQDMEWTIYISPLFQILNSYQSLEYLPPHSKVYRNWLQQQPARLDWDRWETVKINKTFHFSRILLFHKLEIVGSWHDGLEVIWSQVIWGQGWGPGQGMNLNNVSPQTPVIVVSCVTQLGPHKRNIKLRLKLYQIQNGKVGFICSV